MTAPTAPPVDVAARVLERLNIELAEPADVDNGLAVAALAIAYDRLTPAGPTHEELGAAEVALEGARIRITDLEEALANIVRAANSVGARSELLLDGVLEPVGQAILNAGTVIGATMLTLRST